MDDLFRTGLYWAILLFSCVFHECAHVWTALKMGDPTGRQAGRLTLNPIPHIDLFWTIILPIMTIQTTGFPIGGPKPAPVNPLNFKNPRVGDLWCSLAGPGSNLLLAGAALALLTALRFLLPDLARPDSVNAQFFISVCFINGALAVVNLLPVPPLDGSHFLHFVLGRRADPLFDLIARAGWITAIPVYLAFRFLAPYVLTPFFEGSVFLLSRIFGEPYAWELLTTFLSR
jgi:Zn-dependent protease